MNRAVGRGQFYTLCCHNVTRRLCSHRATVKPAVEEGTLNGYVDIV